MRAVSFSTCLVLGGALQQLLSPLLAEGSRTEEVVVTGTRTEQSVWDSPVKVSLVNREAIQKNHAPNAYEAIKNLPGIDFKRPRGKEGQSAVIQGVSANRVLVLIDGEPVSASTGSTVDLTQISTVQIERIEVVKGAVSALYGSQAIGGVINIITRKPDEGIQASFSMDVGSWGEKDVDDGEYVVPEQRYNAMLSYANEVFAVQSGLHVTLSNSFLGGYDEYSKPAPKGDQLTAFVEGSYYQIDRLAHSIRYEFYTQDWTTDELKRNGSNPIESYKVDQVDRHTGRYYGAFIGDLHTVKWGMTLENFVNDSQPEPSKYRSTEIQYGNVDVQWDVEWGLQTITQGIEYFYNTLDAFKDGSDELPESKALRSVEYYFQDQITLGDLQLLPGFRFQDDNLFGSKFTPKINGRYDLFAEETHTLFVRVGIGEGYRTPNLKELYHYFDHSHNGYIIYGNSDLQPESAVNYQLELSFITEDNHALSLNLFKNDLENLIDYRPTGEIVASAAVSEYYNIAKARTSGVEINGQLPVTDWMKFNAGYTYLDAKDLVKDRRLNNRPRHQAKASIDTHITDRLNLLVNGRFYGDQVQYNEDTPHKTNPYSVVDLKINYSITDHIALFGGVDNFSDTTKNYIDAYDQRPRDGRFIYTGFTLTY